jgi:hypothetical protein
MKRKRSRLLLYALVALVTITAFPLMVRGGTWRPLNNQPPMPDIFDPLTGQFLSHGGAAFPILLTDVSVIVQNVNSDAIHANGNVMKLTPDANGSYLKWNVVPAGFDTLYSIRCRSGSPSRWTSHY